LFHLSWGDILKKKVKKNLSWVLWKGALAIDAWIYAATMAIVASTFDNDQSNYILQNPHPKRKEFIDMMTISYQTHHLKEERRWWRGDGVVSE